ncbi:MAG: hypothetical protein ACKPKO_14895, partial [Candidatus Fonsibacter sp.]
MIPRAIGVFRLLSQIAQVLVQGVYVVSVGDSVEGAVVEVWYIRVVFVYEVVEDVIDAWLELVLFEEGEDLLYRCRFHPGSP